MWGQIPECSRDRQKAGKYNRDVRQTGGELSAQLGHLRMGDREYDGILMAWMKQQSWKQRSH